MLHTFPGDILAGALAGLGTPMRFLPLFQLNEGSSIGIYYPPSSRAFIATSDGSTGQLNGVTGDFGAFAANPHDYVIDSPRLLARQDARYFQQMQRQFPQFSRRSSRCALFQCLWFCCDSLQTYIPQLLHALRGPGRANELAGKLFTTPADLLEVNKWAKLEAFVRRQGSLQDALALRETQRCVYFARECGTFVVPESKWRPAPWVAISRRQLELARSAGARLEQQILSWVTAFSIKVEAARP